MSWAESKVCGMVDLQIFYGGPGSGKTRAALQLAEELRVAHGWKLSHYQRDCPASAAVTLLDDDTKPIGMAAFNMIASGEPISRHPKHGRTQMTTVQTLIVCMPTYGPSPVSPDMPVSLVAKVHARKVLDDTRIEEALVILERMKIPPIAIDPELNHKIWLIEQ
eukprot:610768-Prymnesium_polylepis.1